jgi:gamma-glutamyltranspeptidase
VKALNGSGRSPEKLTIEHVRGRGLEGNRIPLTDLNSITVPGPFQPESLRLRGVDGKSRSGGGLG